MPKRLVSVLLTILGILATATAVLVEPSVAALVGGPIAHAAPFIGAVAIALGRQLAPAAAGRHVSWVLVVVALAGVVASYGGLLGDTAVKVAALVLAVAGGFTQSPLDTDGDGVPDIFESK